jgi:hypothetical protein
MRKERPTETLVKNAFSGGAIETEVLEIEGFVLDFEGTIENAKNVARYAKGVVGATGVILTKNLFFSFYYIVGSFFKHYFDIFFTH